MGEKTQIFKKKFRKSSKNLKTLVSSGCSFRRPVEYFVIPLLGNATSDVIINFYS